ncbi:hypothetical protein BkAM31D_04390 [Halalkalibacter krulwichiae]|uniref:Uncharacterized protein n=2 Tax=Halalkalibacter krulwichiae TaxID=199441 RepID=A0A1X9M8Z4_9BACI|nr:hypothetical protein [Halalkalibacter krulwichiae]ARK29154.1 hypothetical protein BkAM31D_04390 [Halalkalibacter krulwichiae]
MKKVLSYYYLPVVFFLLLSLAQLTEFTLTAFLVTILASVAIGLFCGFVLHLVTIIMKNISQKEE